MALAAMLSLRLCCNTLDLMLQQFAFALA